MLLFLIKKTFFDMWDHLLSIFLLNFGGILLLGGIFYLVQLLGVHPLLFWPGVVLGLFVFCLYLGVISSFMGDVAAFQGVESENFFPYLKKAWPVSAMLAAFLGMQIVFVFAMFWYFSLGTFFGIAVAGTLFWADVIVSLSCQFLLPFWKQVDGKLKAVPTKCLMLFFDNPAFSLALVFGTLVLLTLSSFTAFLFPGMATVLLWHHVGVRLRLYKYDYLEEHPNASRKKIPWEELLAEDRDKIGPRSLRGMIFPWKG